MQKRHFRAFIILLVAALLLMSYQSRRGPLRPFGFLRVTLSSLNETIEAVDTGVSRSLRKYTLDEREFARLEREVEALTLKEQRLSEVLAENRRLRALLDLKDLAPGFVAAAQVVSRGSDRWSNTFIINKGGQSGVRGNMAVITPAGLLGKVQETQGDYARVLLIDDTRFRAAVRIEGTRSEAVLAGAGIRRCVLKYLDIDTPVKEGDVIVTSGLDAIFPPGIKVGEVKSVTTSTKELFHRVVVTPFVDTRRVEEVVVVKR